MSQKASKKRRREQRRRRELESLAHHRDSMVLESLLENGDMKGYAQTCWSLAHNAEETPTAGMSITLSGPCEEHGTHEQSFIITLKTLMSIAQCGTVATCGEAIQLVARKLPPEKLPCYQHGHGDQFFDQVTLGIEPRECSYCGELPKFEMPSKSIGWPDEIPVKGIDGEEYRTCPECKGDFLEIQGEKLNQWGWKITCIECAWEIKQAELLDIGQYRKQVEAIKAELQALKSEWESQDAKSKDLIRAAGVAARRLLEMIAFATLIANKDSSGGTPEEMSQWWSPREILNRIEKINPDCFPKPIEITESIEQARSPFKTKTTDVLNKERVIEIYRELNPLVHSSNPLSDEPDYQRYKAMIPQWLDLIENTMAVHQVRLFHHPDHLYVAKMSSGKDGSVSCTSFTLDPEGVPTCGWPECVSNRTRTICQFWNKPWSDCPMPQKEDAQTEGKVMAAYMDEEEAEERTHYLF